MYLLKPALGLFSAFSGAGSAGNSFCSAFSRASFPAAVASGFGMTHLRHLLEKRGENSKDIGDLMRDKSWLKK